MKTSDISKNSIISVSIDKIDFTTVLHLMNLIDVQSVSVFVDKGHRYTLKAKISVSVLLEYIPQASEPILLFDGEVDECPMDEEINILSKKKILTYFDFVEKTTVVLVNLQNTNISKGDIKKATKQR